MEVNERTEDQKGSCSSTHQRKDQPKLGQVQRVRAGCGAAGREGLEEFRSAQLHLGELSPHSPSPVCEMNISKFWFFPKVKPKNAFLKKVGDIW